MLPEARLRSTPAPAVAEITSLGALERLRGQWAGLWQRCPTATPYQSPEWQLAWGRAFGAGKDLRILALRAGDRLVALLPTFVLPSQRKLMLLGAGVSDELDLLAEPAFEQEAARRFVDYLLRNNCRHWDVAELQPLPPSSALRPGGSRLQTSPAIDLARPLPKRIRQNIDYYRRRAERTGPIAFESATHQNFDELFRALVALHCERWHTRGQSGALANAAVQRFHNEAAFAFLRLGILRLYALRIAGRIVAVFHGFLHRARMFYYLGGFDPRFEKVSPGTLLIAHAIEEARREGARTFEFLRGGESYKYLWGAEDRDLYFRSLRP